MNLVSLRSASSRVVPFLGLLLAGGSGFVPTPAVAQSSPLNRIERTNYEDPPIRYSDSTPDDAVIELQARIASGEVRLEGTTPVEKLASLLAALDVPASSQVLTFGKTSLQADKVSPTSPRAIYFSDSIQIGHMPGGVVEIIAADPRLGVNFYTYDPNAADTATFVRETNRCLTCHGAAKTLYVPGLQVRSVLTDPAGQPVLSAGSRRTDQSSPFEERWGGWYVTGTHGSMRHRGNLRLPDDRKPTSLDLEPGANVIDLSDRFDVAGYLTPHSDLVALMVLEHQADAINGMTKARFAAAKALAERDEAIAGGTAAATANEAYATRIRAAAEVLADYLTFDGELTWNEPIAGTSPFAVEFAARGHRDGAGRSLREFDLTERLFRYRCSWLIESEHFRSLGDDLRAAVAEGIAARLGAPRLDGESEELAARRAETLALLRATHADFSGR